jgi:hypothetical protein
MVLAIALAAVLQIAAHSSERAARRASVVSASVAAVIDA